MDSYTGSRWGNNSHAGENTVKSKESGLTLVEVLVAFSVLAGVVVSVVSLIGQNARFLATAEDRLVAGILADNMMVEELVSRQRLQTGATEDVVTFADRQFIVSRIVTELDQEVLQIEFEIRRQNESLRLARIAGLKAR